MNDYRVQLLTNLTDCLGVDNFNVSRYVDYDTAVDALSTVIPTDANIGDCLAEYFPNSTVSTTVSGATGSGSSVSGSRPFIPPVWSQLLWTVIFAVMVTVAILGNLSVIYIILANRRMRTVTNVFLLNLSTADALMALFNAMFNFAFMITSNWPFGKFYCFFSNFVANLTVTVSVLTITATSVDR